MATLWEPIQDREVSLRQEWHRFQGGFEPSEQVRPSILRSWQRCKAAGIDPGEQSGGRWDSRDRLAEAADHTELLEAATPVLAKLKQSLKGSEQVLVLLDPRVRALLVEGDPTALKAAESIRLIPGADWSEPSSGTNAMGTAMAEGGLVSVYAAEHYLEELHPWACAAVPIRHPATGEIVGVLDLSGRKMAIGPHTSMAVLGAAQAIQGRLALAEAALHEVLLSALTDRLAGQRRQCLGVLDRHGRLLRFIGPGLPIDPDHPAWHQGLAQVLATGEAYKAEAMLESGSRLGLTFRPVALDQQPIGALVEVNRPALTGGSGHCQSIAGSTPDQPALAGMIGNDPHWLAAVERAAKGARTNVSILITGETGTGKEVVARAIHALSDRAKGPFIAVNCGALSPALAAAELFGYVGGAFTGANPKGQSGFFEAAQGGTLFLDEVSELTPEVQVALLRVLQEREVTRVGAHRPVHVDVRVVAASNRDLERRVAEGAFRQDLYFRLNVFPVALPPLRERPRDIHPLVAHAYHRLGAEPPALPPSSWQRLMAHHWPGNVRELLNLVEQAVALDEDPANLLPLPSLATPVVLPPGEPDEEERIRQALDECHGNAAAAARALGMGRSTLYRKLEQYGIRLKRQVE